MRTTDLCACGGMIRLGPPRGGEWDALGYAQAVEAAVRLHQGSPRHTAWRLGLTPRLDGFQADGGRIWEGMDS